MSQMRAAALPAGTEQLALVAALFQPADDARTARPGMSAVLLKDQRQMLPDELRTRNASLLRGSGKQPVVFRIQSDGRRLFSHKCRESNMTRQWSGVKPGSRRTPGRSR